MTDYNISGSTHFIERSAKNSMLIQFSSGYGNHSNGLLSFTMDIPPTFSGTTVGLLGTLNGHTSGDLIFRNGTLLPMESTDTEKHVFGQTCRE